MSQQKSGTAPRYERKYLVPTHCPEYLQTLVRLHPDFFSEIYQPRVINNIYFDNFKLQNYFDNLNGLGQRLKLRLRWYTPDYTFLDEEHTFNLKEISSPHFEVKQRSGDLISKYLYSSLAAHRALKTNLPKTISQLFDFQPADSVSNDVQFKSGKTENITLLKADQYQPVLLNAYTRKYFLSADKKLRITIDTDIRFHEIHSCKINWQRYWQLPATVLEIKADARHDKEIAEAANYFPLPLTKSSKYVLGVMSCLPDIESPLYKVSVQPRLVNA